MTDWLSQWYLGLFGAWGLMAIYEGLAQWWREGKQEIKIEEVEHDHRDVQRAQSWRRQP